MFVGDLAPDVTDYVLQEHFRQYFPSVRSAKVWRHTRAWRLPASHLELALAEGLTYCPAGHHGPFDIKVEGVRLRALWIRAGA